MATQGKRRSPTAPRSRSAPTPAPLDPAPEKTPGTGDVWAYMGAGAPAGKSMVHIGAVQGDPSPLLPVGTVAWCREGDPSWTEINRR